MKNLLKVCSVSSMILFASCAYTPADKTACNSDCTNGSCSLKHGKTCCSSKSSCEHCGKAKKNCKGNCKLKS